MASQQDPRIVVAVLAAGAARRMGHPKLTMPYRDAAGNAACLAARAVAAACASRADGMAVVCGAYGDEVGACARSAAAGAGCAERFAVWENGSWERGQATSVACAARGALDGGYDALVVMTADQPFVEARHLDALVDAFRTDAVSDRPVDGPDASLRRPRAWRAVVGGRPGNPCLFERAALPLLLDLRGDEGARQLFAAGALEAVPVPFDQTDDASLFFDIDMPSDFARFLDAIGGCCDEGAAGLAAGVPADHLPAGTLVPEGAAPALPTRGSEFLACAASPAGSTRTPFDPVSLRADFPLLSRVVGSRGETVCYLDSAATALTPEPVRRRVDAYLATSCANIHRGAHLLAEESTDAYELSREHVARFIGASDPAQVVFTHGATESLNLVARCWAEENLLPSDTVVLTEDAHHAAIVPFQMLAERTGIALRFVRVGRDGLLDADSWADALAVRPKLAVFTHTGNVLGFTQPLVARMVHEAHACGALVALDAAQTVGHMPFAVDEGLFDFAAFSAHKMHALTGLGVLWCSRRALREMRPALGGGGMIERVTVDGYMPAPAPAAFEPGTPAITAAVSLDAALGYLEAIGMERVAEHGETLCRRAVAGLAAVPGVRILGPLDARRTSLVSFALDRVHPHDVSARLSERGIMVRAGHHCAMPLHRALGVPASVRASFAVHTTERDIDRLVEAVRAIAEEG